MRSITTRTGRRACGATLLAVAGSACTGGPEHIQTTFQPVTEYGESLNQLFFNTFWFTMPILAVVLLLIVYIMFRFRAKPGQPPPKQIHGNTVLEVVWTFIPAVIVMFIAVPAVIAVFDDYERASEDSLEVEVIGHQWWWEFRYPAEQVVTANHLVLPVGREIHLRIWSADVVHSFWMPRFGGKRDALPLPRTREGERPRANHIVFTLSEPGEWRGQCAEYCGEAHAIMATYAEGMSASDFDAWLTSMRGPADSAGAAPAATPPPPADTTAGVAATAAATAANTTAAAQAPDTAASLTLEERGQQLFMSRACIACHAIAGTTARGVIGPNLTRFGSRPSVGAGALPNTQENVERWIQNPQQVKAGTRMPGAVEAGGGFPPTNLTAEDVRAVAAYLLSLR
jgi:cytochrome c oxidase subunit 2